MRLIVGLGNPGPRYASTRHNVGVMVLEHAASRWGVRLRDRGGVRRGDVAQREAILVQPLAWMNESGPAVSQCLGELKLSPADLIVIHDDLDLAFGRLRVKRSGGSGGHNGIRSIQAAVQTSEFGRLKIGVSRPPVGVDAADYVLEPFAADERTGLDAVLSTAVDALECWLADGLEAVMNRYNVREQGGGVA